jgi:hypothetical protein
LYSWLALDELFSPYGDNNSFIRTDFAWWFYLLSILILGYTIFIWIILFLETKKRLRAKKS